MPKTTVESEPTLDEAARHRSQEELKAEGDRLYETYVQPLEAKHWGEFVVVVPDGRMLLAPTHREAVWRAADELGTRGFVFKIGERVVGTLR